ncbi:MAG: UPF0489 family protein [Candidatus Omnitrophota bacterium]
MKIKPVIYIVEHHHELLFLWRKLGFQNIKILHLDTHCDMHHLLVNKSREVVYILPELKTVDCGNFISLAVRDGIIKEIKWLHDHYGGRDKDMTHVKYTSDLTAVPYRIKTFFSPAKNYPLKYTEILYSPAIELEEGEHLDIDWDFFALKNKTKQQRQKSIKDFLSYNCRTIPEYIYIAYSPDYVSETREEFADFIGCLKDKFKAIVCNYSYPISEEEEPSNILSRYKNGLKRRLRENVFLPFKKSLNKIGIY